MIPGLPFHYSHSRLGADCVSLPMIIVRMFVQYCFDSYIHCLYDFIDHSHDKFCVPLHGLSLSYGPVL